MFYEPRYSLPIIYVCHKLLNNLLKILGRLSTGYIKYKYISGIYPTFQPPPYMSHNFGFKIWYSSLVLFYFYSSWSVYSVKLFRPKALLNMRLHCQVESKQGWIINSPKILVKKSPIVQVILVVSFLPTPIWKI